MRIARKTTRPAVAQNVASNAILLPHSLDRGRDRALVGLGAYELLNDETGSFLGDRPDVLHRRRFDRGDALVGLAKLLLEPGLDLAAFGLCLELGLVARFLADHIGLLARFGKLLLIGRNGGVGLVLHAGGLIEILRDAIATNLENVADARKRNPLQEEVEKAESDRQPEKLGR